MQHDFLQIEIEGEELEELYTDLICLEVELDDELASSFYIKLTMLALDGEWSILNDDRIAAWKPVTITAGFEDNSEELISGYITQIKPDFSANPEDATIEIWGMDASVLLDRVEILKVWPNKKDSDIATEIFRSYGLTPDVEDTTLVHDEAISTIIQRETDMQFLKRLALRNGYEVYVQSSSGYFKSPAVDDDAQPVLAVHFGNETTMTNFSLTVDATMPTKVSMYQIDRLNKEVYEVNVESSTLMKLGSTDANGLLGLGMDSGQVYVSMNSTSGNAEMKALCQGIYEKAEWFVSAEGEILANNYGHVLLPRKPVTIKGIGEVYSGLYYVTHVTHVFTSSGYTQYMKAKRNGLHTLGTENFNVGNGLLVGV
ncbi:Phage protein D [Nitrosomonas marina]|uniref:Phage protein D n=1 Tax=Nitrosomonas marina TaxID=917 RepID=A0A1I0F1B2_9PROT|nr:contractile injection system protein, VgrG/Pvc8 family [Nitrosomonas marina]SET51642.1 Phage protein D [Nitrosomonas marina]